MQQFGLGRNASDPAFYKPGESRSYHGMAHIVRPSPSVRPSANICTAVKRTRVPAGSLVKMAMDEDVDSIRIRAHIESVGAYT